LALAEPIVKPAGLPDPQVDGETRRVRYTVLPCSPLAVRVALAIPDALATVPGITAQEIEVVGYVRADDLSAPLTEGN
jgi:hypothetical protein